MRHPIALLDEIYRDYVGGESLNILTKRYGLPKSTIHYHVNYRRGIKKVVYLKQFKNFDDFYLGVFLGLWAGDGTKTLDKHNRTYSIRVSFGINDARAIFLFKKSTDFLFGLKPYVFTYRKNQLILRLLSKFVFQTLDRYLVTAKPKTLNICLKKPPGKYSASFQKGFLIGLALSDGSLKGTRFCFSTISEHLANQFCVLAVAFGFHPTKYLQLRKEPNWNPIWRVNLGVKETRLFKAFLLAG